MAGTALAKKIPSENVVEVIANEMALGVERAVDHWMSQVELALTDPTLTSLGRLNAVKEIIGSYKALTGKLQLRSGNCDRREFLVE